VPETEITFKPKIAVLPQKQFTISSLCMNSNQSEIALSYKKESLKRILIVCDLKGKLSFIGTLNNPKIP
jgi:hypothetical protein